MCFFVTDIANQPDEFVDSHSKHMPYKKILIYKRFYMHVCIYVCTVPVTGGGGGKTVALWLKN